MKTSTAYSQTKIVGFQINRIIHISHFTSFMMMLFILSSLFAQNKEVSISKTDLPPKIDGKLDDSVWQTCVNYEGFIQFDPFNGRPGSENTSVKVTYDAYNFYVAFQCNDREPDKIAAFLTPREQFDASSGEDGDSGGESGMARANDCVTLILDTFHDRRTSYAFTVNPKGVQKDEPGDYLWMSAARITTDGWQAELLIPFKSIRFSNSEVQTWGINFERYIFRLKEMDYFTRVGRDDVFLDKSATLSGLHAIQGGRNLEFFPYTGFRQSQSGDQSEQKFAVGLDARYAITSDLNVDVTMSPDFSEIESDPFFYQLSPYEYQLQEKRPFFQEGSRYFPGGGDETALFYSKRINDPKIAGKISGKQGKYTIAAVAAINKEEIETGNDEEGDKKEISDGYIGALSLQRDIFKYSKAATMFSGYSNQNFQNVNGMINFNLIFSQILSWDGTAQFSHNSDIPNSRNKSYSTSIHYEPDEGWTGFVEFERIEKHFIPRAGIWRETDQQRWMVHPGYRFRLNKRGIKEFEFEASADIKQTADGTPIGYNIRPVEAKLISLKNHFVNLEFRSGRTKVQLRKNGSLAWHDNYFRQREFELGASYEGSRFYQWNTSFEFSKTPVYNSDFTEAYDGSQIESRLSLSLRPASTIKFSFETEYTKQSKDKDGSTLFEGALNTVGANWQITRYVFFSTNLQYDSYNERMKVDALFGIEFGMGNTFSISYKSRGRTPIRKAIVGDEASTLLLKASYLIRT